MHIKELSLINDIINNDIIMKVKVLDLSQITREVVLEKLSESNTLDLDQIDEYLDILSAIKDGMIVYNISTTGGDYILFITANQSKNLL